MNNPPTILTIIPARFASSRLPGKPLADLGGKPMIVRVYEQAQKITGLNRLIVATDDERIAQAVQQAGGEAELTRDDHPSGSDRVWEVAQRHPDFDWILNLQGDEPLINPDNVAHLLTKAQQTPHWDVMTLVSPLSQSEAFYNPNTVKAVMTTQGRVLYCSRAPIPHNRTSNQAKTGTIEGAYRHIGLYLFKREALNRFTKTPPSPLELRESLEQLRFLEMGLSLYATVVADAHSGVDTPDDLHRIAGLFVNLEY
ncbi:MAG: 3-deoxy-manno-octulosonate cytidylyltransferase [Vampirovibrionales bacterium]|nr:3-deoxy-manno-octulosonate cytidylyltransferase [Vampirovibrionales bacterium]